MQLNSRVLSVKTWFPGVSAQHRKGKKENKTEFDVNTGEES